jgi:preprotein translocase subunit SecB
MTENTTAEGLPKPDSEAQPELGIQKIYLKDVSFESPHSPTIFSNGTRWNPDVNLQLNAETNALGHHRYEVVLTISVTSKVDDKTAFLVELKQAGIFLLKGFDEARLGAMLGSYCPNLLFPFAREAIADFVTKGGFPQLLLAPINFDALYAKHLAKVSNITQGPTTEH